MYNSHDSGLDPIKFDTDIGLSDMFDITALSYMPDTGKPFVASMEGKKYPLFGT